MLPQAAIVSAPDRSPVWPAGSSGSISHSQGFVWAGLSRQEDKSLGLDVEQLFSAEQVRELGSQLLSSDEQRWLHSQPYPETLLYSLAFAGKEALYKALYPDCQKVKAFTAARVSAISSSQLELCLTENWSAQWPAGQCITLDYWCHSGMVWLACEVQKRRNN